LSRLAIEALEPRRLLALDFDYAMADRFGLDLNHNGLIDLPNTATYAQPSKYSLTFSVLDDPSPDPSTVYTWTIRPPARPPTVVRRTPVQIASGDPPTVRVPQGVYATTLAKTVGGTLAASVTRPVSVRDILIVAMGDSYASGEGNPETIQGLTL